MALTTLVIIALLALGAQAACDCRPDQKCVLGNCVLNVTCPTPAKYGKPPASCTGPVDPQDRPKSKLESWFTQEIFDDLFPKANLGNGPNRCWPYSYEAFIIAARYFPEFGAESPNNNGFTIEENNHRDLAAFFAHAIQETGENNPDLYRQFGDKEIAAACFYRGGFYNWFEGGPTSAFLPKNTYDPSDGERCNAAGEYCTDPAYPCNKEKDGADWKGCYFGRGAVQISYNFNYYLFTQWLKEQGIDVDLIKYPNLVVTKMDPPLAMMASMWYYMTPQPPKPAMHDIILGNWKATAEDEKRGYKGPALGPTSLVINAECQGEDPSEPGVGQESRRIKAFKWFSAYFGFRLEDLKLLTCNSMKPFIGQMYPMSYGPAWATTWKDQPCECQTQNYPGGPGYQVYYAPGYYPQRLVDKNEKNRQMCVKDLYANPAKYNIVGQACLKFPPPFVNRGRGS